MRYFVDSLGKCFPWVALSIIKEISLPIGGCINWIKLYDSYLQYPAIKMIYCWMTSLIFLETELQLHWNKQPKNNHKMKAKTINRYKTSTGNTAIECKIFLFGKKKVALI